MSTLGTADELSSARSEYSPSGRAVPLNPRSFHLPQFGTSFFNPVVDLLLICGGFSVPLLLLAGLGLDLHTEGTLQLGFLVLFNYAHFTSSTVRLYTKPGATARHRFLAYGFPAVVSGIAVLAIAFPEAVGGHFMALVLTWSPYHYAAQAYGLALMYSYRSGMTFSAAEKRWLWWICMLPFIRAVLDIDDSSVAEMMGVGGALWLLPESMLAGGSMLGDGLRALVSVLTPVVFILPVAYACMGRSRLPLVALVLVMVNTLWMTAFTLFDAVVWATIAHSIQYLLVVTIADIKDHQGASPGAARPDPWLRVAYFYGISIVLGLGLFLAVPVLIQKSAVLFGLTWGIGQCYLMVVAALNLHHFILDAYIWRSPRSCLAPPRCRRRRRPGLVWPSLGPTAPPQEQSTLRPDDAPAIHLSEARDVLPQGSWTVV